MDHGGLGGPQRGFEAQDADPQGGQSGRESLRRQLVGGYQADRLGEPAKDSFHAIRSATNRQKPQ